MRIEITTGGVASLISAFSFEALMDTSISKADQVLSGFKTIHSKILDIRGQDLATVSAAECIAVRIENDDRQKARMIDLKNSYTKFMENTAKTDQKVGFMIEQNKEKFYQVNPWLRPPSEKWYHNWYEKALKYLLIKVDEKVTKIIQMWESAVAFYQKHKKIVHTIAVVVGAIIFTGLVFITAGTVLIPALMAMFPAAIAQVAATVVVAVMVASNIVSAVMELCVTWSENPLFDSVGFKAGKYAVDTVALISRILVISMITGVGIPYMGSMFQMSEMEAFKKISKDILFFIKDGMLLTLKDFNCGLLEAVEEYFEINDLKEDVTDIVYAFKTV